ncbi:MAG TPA: hypothetical protein VLL08_08800 [Kineosporiaceae bacterium]|nr:hypothetical protein [Kineosporiaceae bacterium]
MDIPGGASDGGGDYPTGPADIGAAIALVAARPGMYRLQEDYRQVVAFVMGWSQARPDVFKSLDSWSITRIGGALDKYGWPGALGVLAADRVASSDARYPHCPLVNAFLTLVCEYIADVEQEGSHQRIQKEHEAALARYDAAHKRSAHPHGTDINSARWHEECSDWQEQYMPALRFARNAGDPWAV